MRTATLIGAFILGACAGTAATTIADSPEASAAGEIASAVRGVVTIKGEHEKKIAPSGKASITVFSRGQNAFFGRLEMDGGGKVPEHRDATEEYLYILEGTGALSLDDEVFKVGPGTSIYMPPNAKVSYVNGSEKLVAIQVFAGPGPAKKYDNWAPQ